MGNQVSCKIYLVSTLALSFLLINFSPASRCFAQTSSSNKDHNAAVSLVAIAKKSPDETALVYANRALQLEPKLTDAMMLKAEIYAKQNRYDKVVDLVNAVIAVDPRNARAWVLRGSSNYLAQAGSSIDSMHDIEKGVKLDPKVTDGHYYLGIAYTASNRHKEAIECFDKAIKVTPLVPNLYRFRAAAYGAAGNNEMAYKDLTTCLKLAPRDVRALRARAGIAQILKKNKEAVADYSKIIEYSPKNYSHRVTRAMAYMQMGKPLEAISDYSAAIKNNPVDEDLFLKRGLVYESLKDYKKALADYYESIGLAPDYEFAYRTRGHLYELMGNRGLAVKDLEKAAKLKQQPAERKIW